MPFYMGLRYFTYCAFYPRFQITDTTQGNFKAKDIVFMYAWNTNLKSFWLLFDYEDKDGIFVIYLILLTIFVDQEENIFFMLLG